MASKKAIALAAVLADQYYTQRLRRLEADREAAAFKKDEDRFFSQLLAAVKETGATKVVGDLCIVVPDKKPKTTIESWAEFCQHLHKTKEYELLEKRVSSTAVAERVAAGKAIPGLKTELVDTLSVTKA